MLGFLRGAVRSTFRDLDFIESNLIYSNHLFSSLHSTLDTMRGNAVQKIFGAFEDPTSTDDEKARAYYQLMRCDQLINKSLEYFAAIELELASGEKSMIKLDIEQSAKAGKDYILLASLDDWTKQKYNFSIYLGDGLRVINPELEDLSFKDTKVVEARVYESLALEFSLREQTVNAIKEWVSNNKKKGYSDLETNSLLVTFFSSLFGNAETMHGVKPKNLQELSNNINMAGTAQKLADRINAELGDVSGQSSETIRKRIKDAIRAFQNV